MEGYTSPEGEHQIMKTVLIAVTAALLGSSLSLAVVGQAQTAKTPSAVAYVSGQRILAETAHGRSQTGRLQTLQRRHAEELRAKQETLEGTRKQLAGSPDPAARVSLQQKELEQRTDLERTAQQLQRDFAALQREVNAEVQRRVKVTLDELMATQSYQMVMNAETSVVWANPELDLTTAVVGRMNGQ